MNKYFIALSFTLTTLISTQTQTGQTHNFTQLLPTIITQAAQDCNVESDEARIIFLNFLALGNEGAEKAIGTCFSFINKDEKAMNVLSSFLTKVMTVVEMYSNQMEAKINTKKKISEEKREMLYKELDEKRNELMMLVTTIYYEILYNDLKQKNADALTFMFDDNGIIAEEQRIRQLPATLQ